jgi:archaellum component FlaC
MRGEIQALKPKAEEKTDVSDEKAKTEGSVKQEAVRGDLQPILDRLTKMEADLAEMKRTSDEAVRGVTDRLEKLAKTTGQSRSVDTTGKTGPKQNESIGDVMARQIIANTEGR